MLLLLFPSLEPPELVLLVGLLVRLVQLPLRLLPPRLLSSHLPLHLRLPRLGSMSVLVLCPQLALLVGVVLLQLHKLGGGQLLSGASPLLVQLLCRQYGSLPQLLGLLVQLSVQQLIVLGPPLLVCYLLLPLLDGAGQLDGRVQRLDLVSVSVQQLLGSVQHSLLLCGPSTAPRLCPLCWPPPLPAAWLEPASPSLPLSVPADSCSTCWPFWRSARAAEPASAARPSLRSMSQPRPAPLWHRSQTPDSTLALLEHTDSDAAQQQARAWRWGERD